MKQPLNDEDALVRGSSQWLLSQRARAWSLMAEDQRLLAESRRAIDESRALLAEGPITA